MKNPYIKSSFGMYMNYLMLGMINIIIASNMDNLSERYGVTIAKISLLVSAIGIGKLIALFFVGRLSDGWGRKPVIITANFLYLLFLVGIPTTTSYVLAFVFAISAGIANSLLDSGTYPALTESFPTKASSASVLVKASVSIGATLLPFIMAILVANHIFWGWTFFGMGALYLLTGIYLIFMPFPNHKLVSTKGGDISQTDFKEQPKFLGEGLAIILMGFTSTALFVVWQTWLPQLGTKLIGLESNQAIQLLSYFSIGALVSVLLLAIMLDKFISPIMIAIIYPIGAFLSMLTLFMVESYSIVIVSTFLMGLFTSGIFQLALSIMMKLFPASKATASSYVNIAASSAFILVPIITSGLVSSLGISMTLIFDMIIAVISVILAVFVLTRLKKIFG
ncbi:MFS transporter [Priestia megaterium]|jgi:MFS family permease|uniref:MFS transporter n=3 Tax=Priestia megaterium TaxID=1404 RepID=A0AAE5P873_PRIMG|nr:MULTISPECIES: MFS transporter [Priestia]MBZ5482998.1 MFS transporter [Bacillus sp. T_4]MDD9781286.1 MFS transporter [Priestia megaterium]MDH2449233.1 MFS transporter [Priestia megaterium]MDL5148691.1 MFS transporter [Priestia megaterium]MDP9726775.1 MFS family permease [Priestia aryabhattai]